MKKSASLLTALLLFTSNNIMASEQGSNNALYNDSYLNEINSEIVNQDYRQPVQLNAQTQSRAEQNLSVNDMLKRLKSLVRNQEI